MKTLDKLILTEIKNGLPVSQKELASHLGVKPSAVAQALTRLQELVVLQRRGTERFPRLKVFALMDQLFEAQRALQDALA